MKYCQLIFGFLFLIFAGLNAEWIEISENYDKEIFEFDSGDYSNIQVDFNLKGYEKKTIFHKDNDYLKITVPDENRKMEVGKPDLPVYSRLFMIPDEGEVFLQVEYGTVELIENVELFPVQDYDDKEIGSDQDLILDQ
ncbi:MAG: hypothetical protein JW996_00490, partial [Candidatus Cloacimonetes bacterium]|nr:hypothetical protein [Candidatus Cloacimonadota bacterium]